MKQNNKANSEINIGMFVSALIGLTRSFRVSFGIDKDKNKLIVRDEDTLLTGSVEFDKINKAINRADDELLISKARELTNIINRVAPHLNSTEADTILLILAKALERMEREGRVR